MNGARPSPLKINKESHLIEKSSSTSSSSSSGKPPQQQRHPVIIYTQSPKVIRTQARDFMALVQKLTGLSRPDAPPSAAPPPPACSGSDDGTSSSVVTEENNGGGGGDVTQASSSSGSVVNPFFSDVPLFAPSASELFCSPQPFYRLQETPNLGSSISPTIMENIKAYREY